MDLLEREPVLDLLETMLGHAREGSGRVVVVRGEAGIGKTSVVKAFIERHREDAHVLWGACDDLLTPQPLGPVWDMALEEPSLQERLGGVNRGEVFRALHELLTRQLRPTVMVVEDLHWADESTSDLVRYLGRRMQNTHGALILTVRDEDVAGNDPIQLALGDLPPSNLEQIMLNPLSRDTISRLAGDVWDPGELWQLTNGNPFLVSEIVETRSEGVPVSIRDATRARVLRLSKRAREVVELASVVPGKAEIAVIGELLSDSGDAISEGVRAGILEVHDQHISFRHELARRAVEKSLSAIERRELNVKVLQSLEGRDEDVAICAHFARETGEAEAVLRFLPQAARRAIELGSRREALSNLRALEPYLDQMEPEHLADHYEVWAQEEHFGAGPAAEELIETAIELRRQLGNAVALGRTLLLGVELLWWREKGSLALNLAEEAMSVLEGEGGEDLAMAYSTMSRLSMLAGTLDETLLFANKALAQVGSDPSRARIHALNNRGTAIAELRYPDGLDDLQESYQAAQELGLVFDQARAAHNIGWVALNADRDTQHARRWLQEAVDLVEEAEIPGVANGARSGLAWIDSLRGDWERAERVAQTIVEDPAAGIYQAVAAFVLAQVLIRSGRPEAKDAAVDAWARAQLGNEPQFLAPAGWALAEFTWLGGEVDRAVMDDIVSAYREEALIGRGPAYSELGFWLSMIGEIDSVHEDALAPFVQLRRGEWADAVVFWDERDIPYEKAICLSFGDNEAKLEALTILDGLGAIPLASRIRSDLRKEGVDQVPRGPQRATRESRLGLTPRQTEVLGLLAEELTNAEIADRLFLSERTVENHVSAILYKLDAADRVDAVKRAREAQAID